MTKPLSSRAVEDIVPTPPLVAYLSNKGTNSFRNPTDSGSSSGGAAAGNLSNSRVSRNRLEDIALELTDRDVEILRAFHRCRYLMTRQVQRLFFTDSVSPTAGLRTANRILARLKGFGVADTLSRRIGGARAGSGSLVWYLTPLGERLLRIGDDSPKSHKRFIEPSVFFLTHTLAVAECYVHLKEICDGEKLKLYAVEQGGDCWRAYSSKGKKASLRPDLFAITEGENYEDRWFFEVDLKTEAVTNVLKKCRRYHEYYKSGQEQQQHGVFPLTVWIVPDEKRKESLVSHIRAEFAKQTKIFTVITPDELEPLIRQVVDGGALC